MNEKTIIDLIRQEVESATPTGTEVRTDGGSNDLSNNLPIVIIKWDTNPISTGHIPFDRYQTDASGDETGTIYVKTFGAKFKFIVKSESEADRDSICNSIQRNFIIFEDKSDLFHDDTTSWNVGGIKPRTLQAVEPDWYEGYIPTEFQFVKEITDSGETLTGTNNTYNIE